MDMNDLPVAIEGLTILIFFVFWMALHAVADSGNEKVENFVIVGCLVTMVIFIVWPFVWPLFL